nr:hypothetical protein [Tanacetum cinerariifolium]
LEGCITEAPKDLDQLECLDELIFWSTWIKHLPNNICMLKHLKFLELKSCWLIEKLPEDLVKLECLEELYLTECIFLRDIPKSICEMKRLKYFHLPYCILVEKLPKELGRRFESFVFNKTPVNVTVGSLSELHLIAESVESISSLRSLRKLKLEGCITEAPKDLDQLECLEELIFWSTRIKRLPNNICMMKHLKLLELKSCWLIEKLPEDLVKLECLEELYLTESFGDREEIDTQDTRYTESSENNLGKVLRTECEAGNRDEVIK